MHRYSNPRDWLVPKIDNISPKEVILGDSCEGFQSIDVANEQRITLILFTHSLCVVGAESARAAHDRGTTAQCHPQSPCWAAPANTRQHAGAGWGSLDSRRSCEGVSRVEPRTCVLDASVAWLEVKPPLLLLAPGVELLNAGWKGQRQGAITEVQFLATGELAPRLFSERIPAETLLSTAQRWSHELDHPAYDCLYLTLAEQRSAVMLTQEQRLLRKCNIFSILLPWRRHWRIWWCS